MPSVPSRDVWFIGIDPGMGGGIAIIQRWSGKDTTTALVIPMPQTERDVADVFTSVIKSSADRRFATRAVIEKVHAMPGQGVSSMFKFGMNYGFLRGCLITTRIPFEEVSPRTWMKELGIPVRDKTMKQSEWKNLLKQRAQQMFPLVPSVTLKTADALLIAEYCRRTTVL